MDLKSSTSGIIGSKTGVVQKRQAIFNFGMRPEQQSAVEKAVDYFKILQTTRLIKIKFPFSLECKKCVLGKPLQRTN